jgi:hypothetical protein
MRRFTYAAVILAFLATLACGIASTPAVTATGYRYDGLPEAPTSRSSVAEYRAISKWDITDITYGFLNGTGDISGDREWDDVRQGFDLWAQQTPLTFTEVSDPSQADIVVSWETGDHGDGDPFDGPGDVLAHASYPNPYEHRQVILHFDEDETWVDNPAQDVDLVTVAAHEIGHTLGLDHSGDSNSLMYPAYMGSHRFLDQDDIGGIQSLYGMNASAPKPPEEPSPNEPAPSSPGQDSDGDGLSDSGEVLKTGTDPRNPDSDGDGLGDGVEVNNNMNPLDPDMDRDGVSDGDEVAAGTDPFLPDEGMSSDLAEQVSEFLSNATEVQIQAFQENDPSIAGQVMSGTALAETEQAINSLQQQGLVELSELDYYQSYIHDIRVLTNTQLEVDTCEVWTTETYQENGDFVDSRGPELLPQTITIEKLDQNWYITEVQFFDAPAFCS